MSVDQLRTMLIGSSEIMEDLRKQIAQVANTTATVLVWGESGTGKELVASGIHSLSSRFAKNLVPLNCGAIPKELFESELFGHEKGAFSGAIAARTGRFELAHEGTLFLDEIGEMPMDMQVKMLRALQERVIERVGGGMPHPVDVRIVAATNRCLETAITEGLFREDLFYRLNVYPIIVPPLRERGEDVIELFNHLAQGLALEGYEPITLSGYARIELLARNWPGNVRELSNLVEQMSIRYPGEEITLEMLPPASRRQVQSINCSPSHMAPSNFDPASGAQLSDATSSEEQAALWAISSGPESALTAPSDADLEEGIDLKEHLRQVEVGFIERALHLNTGNVTSAAKLLGLRRTTLIEKIKKHEISYSDGAVSGALARV
jgi:sigma-54 specific flagellar transcriptional regulator A